MLDLGNLGYILPALVMCLCPAVGWRHDVRPAGNYSAGRIDLMLERQGAYQEVPLPG
jgi:hypothetical protein